MKRFSDINSKIKIEIEDREGNIQGYELQHLSPKKMKELQKRAAEVKKNEDPALAIDVGMEQMVAFFGGKEEEYEKYSIQTILAVIQYMWEQINSGKSQAEQERK